MPDQLPEPLPPNVATLEFIPDVSRKQYARQMDGTYKLAYILQSDTASFMAYQTLIATGKLSVTADQDTPSLAAVRSREALEQEQAVLKMADDLDAAARAEREAARQPAYEKELAALRRKYGK